MKINIGDYVKIKNNHGIAKIIEKEKDDNEFRYEVDKYYEYDDSYGYGNYLYEDFVLKSSPNLIDLIEVGDLVNKKEVLKIHKEKDEIILLFAVGYLDNKKFDRIKPNILTKEQFDSMKYETKK